LSSTDFARTPLLLSNVQLLTSYDQFASTKSIGVSEIFARTPRREISKILIHSGSLWTKAFDGTKSPALTEPLISSNVHQLSEKADQSESIIASIKPIASVNVIASEKLESTDNWRSLCGLAATGNAAVTQLFIASVDWIGSAILRQSSELATAVLDISFQIGASDAFISTKSHSESDQFVETMSVESTLTLTESLSPESSGQFGITNQLPTADFKASSPANTASFDRTIAFIQSQKSSMTAAFTHSIFAISRPFERSNGLTGTSFLAGEASVQVGSQSLTRKTVIAAIASLAALVLFAVGILAIVRQRQNVQEDEDEADGYETEANTVDDWTVDNFNCGFESDLEKDACAVTQGNPVSLEICNSDCDEIF
jgi:hypothetical protein